MKRMHRKKRKSPVPKLMIIFVLTVMTALVTGIGEKAYNFIKDSSTLINPIKPTVNSYFSDIKLYSPHAILVELNNRRTLMECRSEERIYPASLTKMMTAIVAIENVKNLRQPVTLPRGIFHDLYTENASMAGFLPNEQVSAEDLLYGIMLPSGADASIGLSIYTAGSETKFVEIMNSKAKELGMKHTHFTNVCGLQDANHYSTVKDLSVLLAYALKNSTFRRIFTSTKHYIPATNMHPSGITVYSTMFKSAGTGRFNGGRLLGGKTGYTEEAGLCLASLAEKNGKEYILVTAGAEGDHKTKQYDILDALNVYGKIKKE